MKNSAYLIILLAAALLAVTYRWIYAENNEAPAAVEVNTTIHDIMTRTSVRAYTDQAVSEGQIDTMLRAAMAAPTAGNKQPWRFVVIDQRATLDTIAARFRSMTMAAQAQLAIIVCGDVTATFGGDGRDYWIEDTSAATENLLLAAHTMGLGAVWCGIYPMPDRVKQFSEMLGLPEEVLPMACVCIGYPAGETTPKDKWKPEYVHYNTWSETADKL